MDSRNVIAMTYENWTIRIDITKLHKCPCKWVFFLVQLYFCPREASRSLIWANKMLKKKLENSLLSDYISQDSVSHWKPIKPIKFTGLTRRWSQLWRLWPLAGTWVVTCHKKLFWVVAEENICCLSCRDHVTRATTPWTWDYSNTFYRMSRASVSVMLNGLQAKYFDLQSFLWLCWVWAAGWCWCCVCCQSW